MRLLATGDWQAGVTTVALEDQEQVWQRMADLAIERKVDAFLHGGDLYHGPTVSMEQIAAVRRVFNRLRESDIPILVLRGNGSHDLAMRAVNALDMFRDYEGIHVCDTPTVAVLADKVAVCALPWVHPGRLIASMNGSLTHDEANETTSELLLRIARHLHDQAAQIQAGVFGPANLPTVLLAHWAISGSALPTGLPVDEMREPILSWADLDAIGFYAIIGAHIHQPQRIDNPEIDNTLGVVVGSPQQLNHGETGEHGCWIIDLDSVFAEFVPIESRQFVTIDYLHPQEELEDLHGAIVRVRYTATESESREIDHDVIRKQLLTAGASKVTIEPQIIRRERARAQQISEQLSPLDALAAYCEANDMPTELSLRMLERLKEWSGQ